MSASRDLGTSAMTPRSRDLRVGGAASAAALLLASLLLGAAAVRAQAVPTGVDVWHAPAGASAVTLALPAGVLGFGSLALNATVALEGQPLNSVVQPGCACSAPGIGPVDAMTRRTGGAPQSLSGPGSQMLFGFTIAGLCLTSLAPVPVTFSTPSGNQVSLYDVLISLTSETINPMPAELRLVQTHSGGGSFYGQVPIEVRTRLTWAGGANVSGQSPIVDQILGTDVLAFDGHWTFADDARAGVHRPPAGIPFLIDGNCDGIFDAPVYTFASSPGFFPGLRLRGGESGFGAALNREKEIVAFTGAFLSLGLEPATACPATGGLAGVRDLRVNGQGGRRCSGTAAYVGPRGSFVRIDVDGAPASPIIGAISSACIPGNVPIDAPSGSYLDLGLGGLSILFDGTCSQGPVPLCSFFAVPPGGTFSLYASTFLPEGPLFCVQAALLDASYAAGIGMTQCVDVQVSDDPGLAGTDLRALGFLSDDGWVYYSDLAVGVPFYGLSYDTVHVNMNGNLTFCSGDNDWSPTEAELLGDPRPRIAPAWADWNPSARGNVRTLSTDELFGVAWEDIRSFGPFDDVNSFSVLIDKVSGGITLWYGVVQHLNVATLIAGVSPGWDPNGVCPAAPSGPFPVPAAGVDLHGSGSGMPAGGTPYAALYQLFTSPTVPAIAWDFPIGHLEVFAPTTAPGGPTYANVTP